MAYVTNSDIEERLGTAAYVQLTDDAGTGSADTDKVDEAPSSMISSTSNVLEGAAQVIAFPWLTAASTWYLLKTDGVIRPFIFQDREPIEFNALAEGSEEAFKREKFLYGVRSRYRLAYGYWQFAVRNVFTV